MRQEFHTSSMAGVARRDVLPSCPITLLANYVTRKFEGLLGAGIDLFERNTDLMHAVADFVVLMGVPIAEALSAKPK